MALSKEKIAKLKKWIAKRKKAKKIPTFFEKRERIRKKQNKKTANA